MMYGGSSFGAFAYRGLKSLPVRQLDPSVGTGASSALLPRINRKWHQLNSFQMKAEVFCLWDNSPRRIQLQKH